MTAFLSTLSLRRATVLPDPCGPQNTNFYPRSPCGERLSVLWMVRSHQSFLSTLSLRRATLSPPITSMSTVISIHALLAESDHSLSPIRPTDSTISIHALLAESDVRYLPASPAGSYFYPRSPCGERPITEMRLALDDIKFLSTLSLRRATFVPAHVAVVPSISIHALLAESDTRYAISCFLTR